MFRASRDVKLQDVMIGLMHCQQAQCDGCPYDKADDKSDECLRRLLSDSMLLMLGLADRLGEFEGCDEFEEADDGTRQE